MSKKMPGPWPKTEVSLMDDEDFETLIAQAVQITELPFVQVNDTAKVMAEKPAKRGLNKQEHTSVTALIAYVAYNHGVGEDTVKAILEARFVVSPIEQLPHTEYERVIKFLVDLRLDEIMN